VSWDLDGRLLELLDDLGVELERVGIAAYLVTLRGSRRPSTRVWLVGRARSVDVEAFVVHVVPDGCPDPSALHRHLLSRNLGLRYVRYGLDDVGDVFLTGALPLEALTATSLDAVLGEVLALLERDQDALLRLGYGDRLAHDGALRAKVLSDGAGRRPASTSGRELRRDLRR
jgi:hypothetical protein